MRLAPRYILLLVSVVALVSCRNDDYAGPLVKAPVSEVTGTWSAPGAGSITLAADHTFTSRHLRFKGDVTHCLPSEGATGRWGFWKKTNGSMGSYTVSYTVKSGRWVGLDFAGTRFDSDCGGLQLDAHRLDGTLTLCVTGDPDAPCGSDIRLRKRK